MFLRSLLPKRRAGMVAAAILLSGSALAGAVTGKAPDAELKQEAVRLLSNAPLYFEHNDGQTDSSVRFLSRRPEQTLFLTEDEAVLSLSTGVVRIRLEGSSPATIEGIDKLSSTSGYFVGNRPEAWRPRVANYGKVRYGGVYPGIDLVYYGRGQQLEHDFIVAPGADPGAIRMRLDGADGLAIDQDGALRFEVGGTEMSFSAPYAFYEEDGERVEVAARFILGDEAVGFSVDNYDRSKALVIDPVLSYSTYFSGSNAETAAAVAVTPEGHIIIAGFAGSYDFPTNGIGLQDYGEEGQNGYVTKLDPYGVAGGRFLYSGYFGGDAAEDVYAMKLDSAGNIYVVGTTQSADFPVTDNAPQTARPQVDVNGYLVKFNLDSDPILQFGTYFGGEGRDEVHGVDVDSAQRAFYVGTTEADNIKLSETPFLDTYQDRFDAFLTVVDTIDGTLLYSTYLGGTNTDIANDVVATEDGRAFVTGYTFSGDFPVSDTPYRGGQLGGGDAFLTEIYWQRQGEEGLGYSTHFGGTDVDVAHTLVVDPSGAVHLIGYTLSTNMPTSVAAPQRVNGGNADIFIATIDPTKAGGEGLLFSTYIGGAHADVPNAAAIDSAGGLVIGGYTMSTDLPLTGDIYDSEYNGLTDAFVLRVDPDLPAGQGLTCASYFGGSALDVVLGVAVDNLDNVYVAGYTMSEDFPVTSDAYMGTRQAPYSAFVSKFGPCTLPSDSEANSDTTIGGRRSGRTTGRAGGGSSDRSR